MTLSGLVDLHCHYVPDVDDGVRIFDEGVALCRALRAIGYAKLIATPHMRPGMFDNDASRLRSAFEAFAEQAKTLPDMPELGLASEHFFDPETMQRLTSDEGLPYPGRKSALVELPPERMPLGLRELFFRLRVRGLRPVIAHPERYTPLFRSSDELETLIDHGALAQLDVMSLVGKYGRKPKHTAERLLEEGLYFLACSDSHKPADVPLVARAIERLRDLVGDDRARELLSENPERVLAGTVPD